METRNGVIYNLGLSKYTVKTGKLLLYFSSELHRKKFIERRQNNRETINGLLTKRIGIAVDLPELADVLLYKKVETRGFRITNDCGDEICQDQIIFAGGRLMSKNFHERLLNSTQK